MVGSEREEGKRDIGSVTEESVTEAKRMRTSLDSTALEDGGGVQKLPSMADLNETASLIAEEAVEERGKAAGEGEGRGLQRGNLIGTVVACEALAEGVEVKEGSVLMGDDCGNGVDEQQPEAGSVKEGTSVLGEVEPRAQGVVAPTPDVPVMTGVNGLVEAEEGVVGEDGQQLATSGVERLLEPSLVMMDVSVNQGFRSHHW